MGAGFSGTRMKGGTRFMTHIPVEDLLKKVENVYEACIVAAKEARRLNELKMVEQEKQAEEEELVENEIGLEERLPIFDHVEEEKVTVQALKRLLDDKVNYFYADDKK